MTDVKVVNPTAGVGRLGTAAAWISAVACLPYLFLKLVWTLDQPVGVTDRSQLHSSEWVAGNAVMAVVQLAAVVLVLALVRPWSRRVPTWLLLFPVWVGTGLLFQVVVGRHTSWACPRPRRRTPAARTPGRDPSWVYVVVYSAFAGQGVALAIAFACHVRARWGRMLGERTGDVLARRPQPDRGWRITSTGLAEAVAVMAPRRCRLRLLGGRRLVRALRSATARLLGMQASRAVGAVIATAGLLGLAGRWGHQSRFWLPVASSGSAQVPWRLRCANRRAQPARLDARNHTPRGRQGSDRHRPGAKRGDRRPCCRVGVRAVTAAARNHGEPQNPAERHLSGGPPHTH